MTFNQSFTIQASKRLIFFDLETQISCKTKKTFNIIKIRTVTDIYVEKMGIDAYFYVNSTKTNCYKLGASETLSFKKVTKNDVIPLKFEYEEDEECWLNVYVLDLKTREIYPNTFTEPDEEFKFKFCPTVYGHDVEVYICMNLEHSDHKPDWHYDYEHQENCDCIIFERDSDDSDENSDTDDDSDENSDKDDDSDKNNDKDDKNNDKDDDCNNVNSEEVKKMDENEQKCEQLESNSKSTEVPKENSPAVAIKRKHEDSSGSSSSDSDSNSSINGKWSNEVFIDQFYDAGFVLLDKGYGYYLYCNRGCIKLKANDVLSPIKINDYTKETPELELKIQSLYKEHKSFCPEYLKNIQWVYGFRHESNLSVRSKKRWISYLKCRECGVIKKDRELNIHNVKTAHKIECKFYKMPHSKKPKPTPLFNFYKKTE